MLSGEEKSRGRWMPEESRTESRSGWEARTLFQVRRNSIRVFERLRAGSRGRVED
jgi:hypothetical protein